VQVLDVGAPLNVFGVDWLGDNLGYTLTPAPGAAGVRDLVVLDATFTQVAVVELGARPLALDLAMGPARPIALLGLDRANGFVGTARLLEFPGDFLATPLVSANDTDGTIFAVRFAGDAGTLSIAEESISADRPGRSAIGYAYVRGEFALSEFDTTGNDFRADLRAVAVSSNGARVVFGGEDVAGPTRNNVVVYETGL